MEDGTTKSGESPAWQTDEFRIYEYKVRVVLEVPARPITQGLAASDWWRLLIAGEEVQQE
jgi:hypothetical protein